MKNKINQKMTSSILTITLFAALMLIPTGMNTNAFATPTFTSDFSSYADDVAFAVDYPTSDATNIHGESDTDQIEWIMKGDATADILTYDLGGITSGTEWVYRMVLNWDVVGGNLGYFGLSDNTSARNLAQDFIGFYNYAGQANPLRAITSDGAAIPSGIPSGSDTWIPTVSTDYYVTLTRTSATTFTVDISTGDYKSNTVATLDGTVASTVDNLRYLKFANYAQNSGGVPDQVVNIKEMKFYDGVTLAPTVTNSALQSQVDTLTSTVASLNATVIALNNTVTSLNAQVSVIDTLVAYIDTFLDRIFINYDP